MEKALEVSSKVVNDIVTERGKSIVLHASENIFFDRLFVEIEKLKSSSISIIAIVGGAGSGKTTLVKKLCSRIGYCDYIGTDDYVVGDREYRKTNLEGKEPTEKYDFVLLNKKVTDIRAGKTPVAVPRYDEATGIAVAIGEDNFPHIIKSIRYLFVEGDFDVVEKPDLKIYLHVPDEARLQNRIRRDMIYRGGKDMGGIIQNFNLRQRLQHISYTLKAAKTADYIIVAEPNDSGDEVEYTYSLFEVSS